MENVAREWLLPNGIIKIYTVLKKKYLYGKKKSIIFPTYGFINLYLALHKCVTKRGKRLEM